MDPNTQDQQAPATEMPKEQNAVEEKHDCPCSREGHGNHGHHHCQNQGCCRRGIIKPTVISGNPSKQETRECPCAHHHDGENDHSHHHHDHHDGLGHDHGHPHDHSCEHGCEHQCECDHHGEQSSEQGHENGFPPDFLEFKHFRDIQYALLDYSQYMLGEWKRRAHAYTILPPHQKKYFQDDYFMHKLDVFRDCILENSKFLCSIALNENYYTEMFGFPTRKRAQLSDYDQMSKVESTLHQFVRDWSKEGEQERQNTYVPILEKLEKYLPIKNKEEYRVLVPGSGLSRLLYEIVKRGYEGQGNEFSYYMLLGSTYMLNTVAEENSITIYPWINSPNNCVNTFDNFRPIIIPDEAPLLHLTPEVKFSMCAGDFEECYGNQESCWDAVTTCFFIDTAPNVLNYLDIIYKILKPGGYWINYGPLLYHWQTSEPLPEDLNDPRYSISIELSFEEIQMAMEKIGFKILEQERKTSSYTHNILSMMGTSYNSVFFVAQKPLQA